MADETKEVKETGKDTTIKASREIVDAVKNYGDGIGSPSNAETIRVLLDAATLRSETGTINIDAYELAQLESYVNSIKRVYISLAKSRQEITQKSAAEFVEMQEQIKTLKSEKADVQDQCTERISQVEKETQDQINNMLEQLNEKTAQLDEKSKSLDKAEEALSTEKELVKLSKEKTEAAEIKSAHLQEIVDELNPTIENQKEQLLSFKEINAELTKEVETLNATIDKMTTAADETAKNHEKEIEMLSIDHLKVIANLEKTADIEKRNAIADTREKAIEKIEHQQDEIKALNDKIADLQGKLSQAEIELAKATVKK